MSSPAPRSPSPHLPQILGIYNIPPLIFLTHPHPALPQLLESPKLRKLPRLLRNQIKQIQLAYPRARMRLQPFQHPPHHRPAKRVIRVHQQRQRGQHNLGGIALHYPHRTSCLPRPLPRLQIPPRHRRQPRIQLHPRALAKSHLRRQHHRASLPAPHIKKRILAELPIARNLPPLRHRMPQQRRRHAHVRRIENIVRMPRAQVRAANPPTRLHPMLKIKGMHRQLHLLRAGIRSHQPSRKQCCRPSPPTQVHRPSQLPYHPAHQTRHSRTLVAKRIASLPRFPSASRLAGRCTLKQLKPPPMNLTQRRGAIAFAIILGAVLTGVTVTLNIGWIILNERRAVLLVLGIIFFAALLTGVVLNTIFLVREVRRNQRQDSFLNAVTHELKTPIASIRLYLETLQRREVSEPQRQEFYKIMLADSERLHATVERVLKAGELGQRGRDRRLVELEPLLAECIRTTLRQNNLPPEAITLQPVPGAVRLHVRGISEDLRTAVMNVLENAVKYSPDGVAIRVSLLIERYTDAVIRFSDTGVGLPPGQQKRIFRRFYRVPGRNSSRIKGTGLGLFLVRHILRQHGGNATADSRGPGRGTTLTLTLPLDTGNLPRPGEPAS